MTAGGNATERDWQKTLVAALEVYGWHVNHVYRLQTKDGSYRTSTTAKGWPDKVRSKRAVRRPGAGSCLLSRMEERREEAALEPLLRRSEACERAGGRVRRAGKDHDRRRAPRVGRGGLSLLRRHAALGDRPCGTPTQRRAERAEQPGRCLPRVQRVEVARRQTRSMGEGVRRLRGMRRFGSTARRARQVPPVLPKAVQA